MWGTLNINGTSPITDLLTYSIYKTIFLNGDLHKIFQYDTTYSAIRPLFYRNGNPHVVVRVREGLGLKRFSGIILNKKQMKMYNLPDITPSYVIDGEKLTYLPKEIDMTEGTFISNTKTYSPKEVVEKLNCKYLKELINLLEHSTCQKLK